MPKRSLLLPLVLCVFLFLSACGQVADNEEFTDGPHGTSFQNNRNVDDFVLTDVFYDYGGDGLTEMWDSIDPVPYNERFTETVNNYTDDFVDFANLGAKILGHDSQVVILLAGTDAGNLLKLLIDSEANFPVREEDNPDGHYFTGDGDVLMGGFYAFLDEVFKDTEDDGAREAINVNYKIVSRLLAKRTPQQIHDDIEEIIEDTVKDPDFKDDFIDLTSALGKILVRADYPQKDEGGESLETGNSVQGLVNIFRWYNILEKNPDTRALLESQVKELVALFDPNQDSTDPGSNAAKIKKLLANIEDYFTSEGSVYNSGTAYPDNLYAPIDTAEIYSDVELGNTIRELLPGNVQMMMRSDRPNSMINTEAPEQPVYLMGKLSEYLRNLEYDPDTANIEQSIYNLLRYDLRGRDRLNDDDAHGISHLENLIFLTHVTSNAGWWDGNITGEIINISDSRYDHGHGDYKGRLTLNDSLFSITTHKTGGSLGLFEVGLRSDDGNNIHRSRHQFTRAERDSYKFFFNQNYDVLQCLAPPCLGDLGSPNGGNPDISEFPERHVFAETEADMNQFRAYSPDGLDENQLASWTLGLVVRACFNGEGPYYYAPDDAESETDGNGKDWYIYSRPNGKIYAYVHKPDLENADTWEYFYPADDGDPVDDSDAETTVLDKHVRYNRYKVQWDTDHYMIVSKLLNVPEYCTFEKDENKNTVVQKLESSGETAKCLTYDESIMENDITRECSSPEEALFRNYQWFMTEKKMVLIIPLRLATSLENVTTYAGVLQILEANGLEGLCALRKFEANQTWAKKGTTGNSTIPGDYRIEVVSSLPDSGGSPFCAFNIYHETLDCGHATPPIVGMNIFALTRLGFPRYVDEKKRADYRAEEWDYGNPEYDDDDLLIVSEKEAVYDNQLGSKEFSLNDAVWNDRNAILPPFISLIAALREYTPQAYDNPIKKGIRSFTEGTSPLLKPLVYYQGNSGAYPHKTWKPIVLGESATLELYPEQALKPYSGDDFLRSSSDFHDRQYYFADSWDGTSAEQRFYLPTEEKTLLGMLIDSDLSTIENRMDGLLPILVEEKDSKQIKLITELLNVFISSENNRLLTVEEGGDETMIVSDLLNSGIEQLMSLMKISQGEMTVTNEDPDTKGIVYPCWMFVDGKADSLNAYGMYTAFESHCADKTLLRDEDIVLDIGIDRVVGQRDLNNGINDGYGLAEYVNEQETDAVPWEDLDDILDALEDHLYIPDNGEPENPYCVVQSLLDQNKAIFGRDRLYTESEISGLIYGLGKLITHYDTETDTWINQGQILHYDDLGDEDDTTGTWSFNADDEDLCDDSSERPCKAFNDLWTIIRYRLPAIHELIKNDQGFSGDNYVAALTVNKDMLKPDGAVEFLVTTMDTNVGWEALLLDSSEFLQNDIVQYADPLWFSLTSLLTDLAKAVDLSKDGSLIEDVYEDFGFQRND